MLRTYAKNGKVKVLDIQADTEYVHIQLLNDGWHHTSTICPKKWIESVCNSENGSIGALVDEIHLGPAHF